MSDCSKHPKELKIETEFCTIVLNNQQLSRAIADLNYESLPDLFTQLAICFKEDSDKDYKKNRKHLSVKLFSIGFHMERAAENAKLALEISKPFMKNMTTNNEPYSWVQEWKKKLASDFRYNSVEEMDTAERSIVNHLEEFLKSNADPTSRAESHLASS